MSLSAKRENLARLHARYQRVGRRYKSRILDEFCATCGYHRKAALRLLNRPLRTTPPKRSGPKRIYDPAPVRPVLKALWLTSDQPCSKLLKAALPAWLAHYQRRGAPLPAALKEKLLQISPAQIDRLLRPARVQHPKRGLSTTRPGTLLHHAVKTRGGPPNTQRPGSVEADTVAHCDDSTQGDYVHSLTFTELFSGWTENRAVWNKSADAVLGQPTHPMNVLWQEHAATNASTKCWFCDVFSKAWRRPEVAVSDARKRKKARFRGLRVRFSLPCSAFNRPKVLSGREVISTSTVCTRSKIPADFCCALRHKCGPR